MYEMFYCAFLLAMATEVKLSHVTSVFARLASVLASVLASELLFFF